MSGAAMYSFALLGLFVSTTGVMLPRMEAFYHLNDVQVSLCFLAGPVGYVISAQLNHSIHLRFGRRGIAVVGPIFQILSAALTAMHPPFPIVLASAALGAFGAGLLDGSWCAWAGRMENANLISGMLHGSFSLGAGCGPVLAELVLSGNKPWYSWFYVLTALSIFELFILPFAFRHENAEKYHNRRPDDTAEETHEKLSKIFQYKSTWICALYLLIYVGTESGISGWIVSFMLRVRHSSTQHASTCSSSFWIGMAAGRLILGLLTDRVGVKRATNGYIVCALVFQILFVTVEGQVASAILIALVGFFCGPLFPSCIILLTRLLPRDLNVAAVSFVASVGQIGGAFLPFGLGALSQLIGLGVFGVVIVIQLFCCLVLWILQWGIKSSGQFLHTRATTRFARCNLPTCNPHNSINYASN
uniref:Major facilitator superfamily (MFS) profile domain-containing protein n=1 Tax=Bionectria ochroleuca TaxID=29856 RepID=A0A0B7JXD6_BIOOC